MDDNTLIREAQRGDKNAFGKLIQHHYIVLYP